MAEVEPVVEDDNAKPAPVRRRTTGGVATAGASKTVPPAAKVVFLSTRSYFSLIFFRQGKKRKSPAEDDVEDLETDAMLDDREIVATKVCLFNVD